MVAFAILCFYFAFSDEFSRVACPNLEIGDVFCNNAARAHHGSFAYGYGLAYNGIAAYKCSFAYGNFPYFEHSAMQVRLVRGKIVCQYHRAICDNGIVLDGDVLRCHIIECNIFAYPTSAFDVHSSQPHNFATEIPFKGEHSCQIQKKLSFCFNHIVIELATLLLSVFQRLLFLFLL